MSKLIKNSNDLFIIIYTLAVMLSISTILFVSYKNAPENLNPGDYYESFLVEENRDGRLKVIDEYSKTEYFVITTGDSVPIIPIGKGDTDDSK